MTLKGDAIFKEKLSGGLKNDIRNLIIFMRAVWSLKSCTWMGSFCPKHRKSTEVSSPMKVIQRKANSWEICVAIDLKQSIEGTFKVYWKSLTTVLGQVYFIVNLYSFPLFLVPQANPSFPKVSLLPPSQVEQLPVEQWRKIWINLDLVLSKMAWGIG